ncbi:MAG: hypothetical protein M1830_000854 [Pleopsidium flavum]|nr:MAG: hypothetical protein M1830_000854 [Pleopsidium flavum]
MAVKHEHYRALVDMGSNGIRFSISDLSPATARNLPTIYQDRCGISLYDAQYSTREKAPIPSEVIQVVLAALSRFKITCEDFGVPLDQIRVIATEATREATNSVDFRELIRDSTGWEVEMLSKEGEGRVGAMGIASSLPSIKGLVMDLGGGSTQLTWMITGDGEVKTSPIGAVSLPYGAAAVTRRLAEAGHEGEGAKDRLRREMKTRFQNAYHDLEVPKELEQRAAAQGGFSLYLSGGGFRGWGYLLMSDHRVDAYPIPIINGFRVSQKEFENTVNIQSIALKEDVFRVSERRASQVPAVAFLITALTEALPAIKDAQFCQGGVREGILYQILPPSIRAAHPLSTATSPYAPPSAQALTNLLHKVIPPLAHPPRAHTPGFLDLSFIEALTNLLYHHSSLPKESRAAAALHSTTTGLLAGTHGISHEDRALFCLTLCERWGGEVAPTDDPFQYRMQLLVGAEQTWWTRYLGRAAALLGEVYPAGVVSEVPRMELDVGWRDFVTRKRAEGEVGIEAVVRLREGSEMTGDGAIGGFVKALEKVGKRKNWFGGNEAWGRKVRVVVRRDL